MDVPQLLELTDASDNSVFLNPATVAEIREGPEGFAYIYMSNERHFAVKESLVEVKKQLMPFGYVVPVVPRK